MQRQTEREAGGERSGETREKKPAIAGARHPGPLEDRPCQPVWHLWHQHRLLLLLSFPLREQTAIAAPVAVAEVAAVAVE